MKYFVLILAIISFTASSMTSSAFSADLDVVCTESADNNFTDYNQEYEVCDNDTVEFIDINNKECVLLGNLNYLSSCDKYHFITHYFFHRPPIA
jgi:hypothetical protein